MLIFQPFKITIKTQGFGIKETKPELLPFYQSIGLKFGHNGFDWTAKDGEPIYWDCDIKGQVLNTEIDGKGGLGVNVISHDKSGNFKHRFWHLKEFRCQAGQILEPGDLIGLADSTGYSTGTHLHRDLKPVIKDQNGNWKTRYPNNGTLGTIDPALYYRYVFIGDYVKQLKGIQNQLNIIQKIIQGLVDFFKGR